MVHAMKTYPTKKEFLRKSSHWEWEKELSSRKAKAVRTRLFVASGEELWFVLPDEMAGLIERIESYGKSVSPNAGESPDVANAPTPGPRRADALSEYLFANANTPLDDDFVFTAHHFALFNTFPDERNPIRGYRKNDVYLVDESGRFFFSGESPERIADLMHSLWEWLYDPGNPFDPLIKSGLAQFYLGLVHPFDDGNGRTSRILAYMILKNRNDGFVPDSSPSDFFDHKSSGYYESARDSRFHNYDVTYFLLYYLNAIAQRIKKTDTGRNRRLNDARLWVEENRNEVRRQP
jgi:hypothetical protein